MKEGFNEKEILQLTKSAFEDYSINADEKVWEGIQNELQQNKNRFLAWWQYGMAAGVLMAIGVGVWLFNSNANFENGKYEPSNTSSAIVSTPSDSSVVRQKSSSLENLNELNHIESNELTRASDLPTESSLSNIAQSEKKQNPVNQPNLNMNSKGSEGSINPMEVAVDVKKEGNDDLKMIDQRQTEHMISDSTAELDLKNNTDLASNEKETQQVFDEEKITQKPASEITAADIDKGMPMEEEESSASSRNTFFIAANLNGAGGANTSAQDESIALLYDTELNQNNPFTTANPINKSNEISYSERTFDLPIQASITFNYAFDKRWSLESGFSYSLLKAKSESENTTQTKVVKKEELHYVGLPLMLNFNFIAKKKFNAFFSVGTGIEKGISYKVNVKDEESGESFSSKENVNGIKYTINSGIGVEYRFIPLLSFYLFPGVTYYSSNEPQPFDIGGSKRTGITPNLRLGLRFHLNNN